MSMLMRVLCFVGVLAWSSALAAEEFPNRSIKFVVPFPAGGPSDFISRVLTEKMASLLGQSIVIENHAGAGGLNGIASVAKSSPDGYTIAIAPSSNLAMMVNLRESMPFQPLKDLALITQIVSVPEIIVVNENVPARRWRNSSRLPKRSPASWSSLRQVSAECRIWPWSCSS
jgi:tripartite-type tricarboxylate transporter receptor subunit TctC